MVVVNLPALPRTKPGSGARVLPPRYKNSIKYLKKSRKYFIRVICFYQCIRDYYFHTLCCCIYQSVTL